MSAKLRSLKPAEESRPQRVVFAALVTTLLLAGEALAAPATSVPTAPLTPVASSSDPATRALEPLLAAEFALQAGQLDDAAQSYLTAARVSQDAVLAERATRISLLTKDDARTTQALALWRRHGGDGLPVNAVDATLALRRGDERAALRQLAALMQATDEQGWRLVLDVLAHGSRDPQQSARILQRLVDRGQLPDRLQPWLAFGGLAQRLEQPKLSEQIVTEVVRRFPGDPRVTLLRVSQLREAERKDEARAVLATLVDQARLNADLRLAVAREYDALGDAREAAQVLSRGPQDDQTYTLRAGLLARAEDKATLTELFDELRRDANRPDPQRRLLIGQLAEYLERYEDALEWYRGVPGGMQRIVARLRTAKVLHELKRPAEAWKLLRDIQSEAAVSEEVRRDGYLLEASLHQKDKNREAEFDVLARGLAAFPDEPEILYARALAWERYDDIARAEADLRKILVADPENIAALNALGYTLADRTDRYTEALALIDRARAADPDNAAIVDSYGWVLYRLGRLKDALPVLQRALTLQKDAEIAAHLAEVLWKLGRKDEARKYFDEARKLDPDSRALKRALQEVGA